MAPPPQQPLYSLAGLKRWSCSSNELPGMLTAETLFRQLRSGAAVTDIKNLHVYDFDNTRQSPTSDNHGGLILQENPLTVKRD